MLNGTKFRLGLAVVTLAGAFHLDRAHAAESAGGAPCDSYADGYANGFCAGKGGRPAGIVYTCNPDGTATIISVSCIEPT